MTDLLPEWTVLPPDLTELSPVLTDLLPDLTGLSPVLTDLLLVLTELSPVLTGPLFPDLTGLSPVLTGPSDLMDLFLQRLRKWFAPCPELLARLPEDQIHQDLRIHLLHFVPLWR